MAKKIYGYATTAYFEMGIWIGGALQVLSIFDRSNQSVRSVSASLCRGSAFEVDYKYGRQRRLGCSYEYKMNSFIYPLRIGKERVTHAMLVSEEIGKRVIITTEKRLHMDVYNFLMKNYKMPLLPAWIPALISELRYRKNLEMDLHYESEDDCIPVPLGTESVPLRELKGLLFCNLTEKVLEDAISCLLKCGKIHISPYKQRKLSFKDMDEYFQRYGSGVMTNLQKQLRPVSQHTDEMKYAALKDIRLYPQQISTDMGVVEYFRKKKGHYAIFNCGMGTGKTIMGAVAVDAYYNSKAMDKNHMSLADVLKRPELVSYRCIIMCPPHLVDKWVSEINAQIPYAKAIALTDFSQLVDLRMAGRERKGKEIYVMSKDFGKLTYMDMPAVTQIKRKKIWECVCNRCGMSKPLSYKGKSCQRKEECDGTYEIKVSPIRKTGFICPSCGELICTPPRKSGDIFKNTLSYFDFLEHNSVNDHCWSCGASLWQPYVRNIGSEARVPKWHRVTHYANKAHKGRKTVWLFKGTAEKYFDGTGEMPIADLGGEGGVRKYAPATFIKKYLKGFFDFAIFDELHQYKAGGSAQGNAMGSLIKASRFQIGLTGTIAGGYSTHLFSLLFRLDPSRMCAKGFTYNSEMLFAEQYGTVERVFEGVENARSNKMSKGRQIASPKEKPGISPRVFTDFLLDRAVFLDLADMSSFLPPLKEIVEVVNTEPEIIASYDLVTKKLKEESKEAGGRGLASSMFQFSLSYPDKPYGVSPILHPKYGTVVATPADLSYLFCEKMSYKEKRLVEIVNKEQAEGRNLVIFAEYTNSEETCVTERLQQIIEHNCGLYGQVQIIKSSSPAAIKREAWLHEKAAAGIRVFITNPKILETGVDLCFKHNGVSYNYPTIIFYQLGTSLFTIWQASRRHYRLIQREECRTYYLASAGTLQPTIIKLIAAKQVATSAIQGKFSSEGIAAMAEGVDVRVQLAKALADKDTENPNELQRMFDVLAAGRDSEREDYTPMPTFAELVGDEPAVTAVAENLDMPSFIEMPDDIGFTVMEINLFDLAIGTVNEKPSTECEDPHKDADEYEMLSLFDLLY